MNGILTKNEIGVKGSSESTVIRHKHKRHTKVDFGVQDTIRMQNL